MARVDTSSDSATLRDIQQRLVVQFPGLAPEVVEAAVRVSRAEWRGLVDDDVPELVELSARARLASLV
jgi:hypothetical protein